MKSFLVFTLSGRSLLVSALTENSSIVKAARAISGRPIKSRVRWTPCGKFACVAGFVFRKPVREGKV